MYLRRTITTHIKTSARSLLSKPNLSKTAITTPTNYTTLLASSSKLSTLAPLASFPKTVSSHHRTFSTTNNDKEGIPISKQAYIHPLSQIILQHLQVCHSDWMEYYGLNNRLTINKDGTFELSFPKSSYSPVVVESEKAEGEGGEGDDKEGGKEPERDGGRIWTHYDPGEKKHYLSIVHHGKTITTGQYLLQDNLKPAWHSDKRSTPEKVQDAVDAMIQKISSSM